MIKEKHKIIRQDSVNTVFLIESKKYGEFQVLIDTKNYNKVKDYFWHVVYSKKYKRFSEIATQKNGKIIKLHQLVMNDKFIDHIDLDIFNNKESNLRLCTNAENIRNSKIRENNTTGMKGVIWHKASSKWYARIGVNYKRINLGLFTDKLEAAKAYNQAALKYHGEFARLNPI